MKNDIKAIIQMQETTLIHENISQYSSLSNTEDELQSKPTTAKTHSRLPTIRTNNRQKKTARTYEPPASDREGWWRRTIKVQLNFEKLDFSRKIGFSLIGYTKSRIV